MKKAVPGQYSLKSPAERQRPHVADDPFLIRHPAAAQRDQRRRTVDAGDAKTLLDDMERNWLASAAALIEHGSAHRERAEEAFDIRFVSPIRGAAIGVP